MAVEKHDILERFLVVIARGTRKQLTGNVVLHKQLICLIVKNTYA